MTSVETFYLSVFVRRFTLQTSPPAQQCKDVSPRLMPQRTLPPVQHGTLAMAQQDIRYYLNGMLLVFEPGRVRAVATDGHRLAAHCSTEADGIAERHEVIVPRKTVLEMQRRRLRRGGFH